MNINYTIDINSRSDYMIHPQIQDVRMRQKNEHAQKVQSIHYGHGDIKAEDYKHSTANIDYANSMHDAELYKHLLSQQEKFDKQQTQNATDAIGQQGINDPIQSNGLNHCRVAYQPSQNDHEKGIKMDNRHEISQLPQVQSRSIQEQVNDSSEIINQPSSSNRNEYNQIDTNEAVKRVATSKSAVQRNTKTTKQVSRSKRKTNPRTKGSDIRSKKRKYEREKERRTHLNDKLDDLHGVLGIATKTRADRIFLIEVAIETVKRLRRDLKTSQDNCKELQNQLRRHEDSMQLQVTPPTPLNVQKDQLYNANDQGDNRMLFQKSHAVIKSHNKYNPSITSPKHVPMYPYSMQQHMDEEPFNNFFDQDETHLDLPQWSHAVELEEENKVKSA